MRSLKRWLCLLLHLDTEALNVHFVMDTVWLVVVYLNDEIVIIGEDLYKKNKTKKNLTERPLPFLTKLNTD